MFLLIKNVSMYTITDYNIITFKHWNLIKKPKFQNNRRAINIPVSRNGALPTKVGSYELSRTGLPDNNGNMLR